MADRDGRSLPSTAGATGEPFSSISQTPQAGHARRTRAIRPVPPATQASYGRWRRTRRRGGNHQPSRKPQSDQSRFGQHGSGGADRI